MDPETLNAMNEGMYRALLTLIEGITLIVGLASALFVIFCLGCVTFGVFAKLRQPARRRQSVLTPAPPEPDEYELLVLKTLDDGLDNSLRTVADCGG